MTVSFWEAIPEGKRAAAYRDLARVYGGLTGQKLAEPPGLHTDAPQLPAPDAAATVKETGRRGRAGQIGSRQL